MKTQYLRHEHGENVDRTRRKGVDVHARLVALTTAEGVLQTSVRYDVNIHQNIRNDQGLIILVAVAVAESQ
jgi:hypothetical protein